MATLVLDERIHDTATITGTGEYTVLGAPTGKQPASVIGANNYSFLFVTDDINWESGIYTYVTGPARLQRTSVQASSNGDAAVNWSNANVKIKCALPAWMAKPRIVTKSIAGGAGDTTLTAAEQRCDILILTGVLTGNRNVIVDETVWNWASVYNSTTGSFTATVKTSGGTGVAVTQGKRSGLSCDGTNVIRSLDDITIADDAVTTAKLAAGAVTSAKLGWFPKGHIQALTHSAAGASANIAFSAGQCADSTGAVLIAPGALTKSTSAWAVGDSQGGKLSAAAIANSTQYYFYAIYRSDTGVSDIGFDVSATTPTMPANYTHSRLIGWARTDGSAQWVKSNSYERGGGAISYEWAVPPLDINLANTLTTSRRTDTLTVPTAFSVVATITATAFDNAAGFVINVCNPDQTDAAPAFNASPLPQLVSAAGGSGVGGQFEVTTSSTGTIASRANLATVNEYYVSTVKFEWSRR